MGQWGIVVPMKCATLLLLLVACHPADPKSGKTDSDVDSATPTITVNDPTENDRPRLANPPKNLLLLTTDTTRVHHFNLRGYSVRTTTPNIDALLQSGLYLSQHQSCSSWTLPSFLCMLTGRSLVSLGHWPDNHQGGVEIYPNDDLPSLARILDDLDFSSGLVYANPFLSSDYNMNQGHDTELRSYSAMDGQPKAFARLDELAAGNDPWFFHYHFNDAHSMYFAPVEYLDAYLNHPECTGYMMNDRDDFNALKADWGAMNPEDRQGCLNKFLAKYDGTIRYIDDYMQDLVDHVEELGELEDTLVVFATDHGDEFFEHEGWEHGNAAFGEVVDSAVVFIHPEIEPEEWTGLTAHEDVLPTIFHYMNLPIPTDLTGEKAWAGRTEQHHLSYRNEDTIQTVRTPTEKLIYRWDGEKQYYNLAVDPLEQIDLYDPEDPRVVALWELLQPKVDELAAEVADEGWAPVSSGP